MRRRGKLVALTSAVVALAVLVAAGVVTKDYLIAYPLMCKVKDPSEFWMDRIAAARKLIEMHSRKAVPVLINAVEMHRCASGGAGVVGEVGGEFVGALLEIGRATLSAYFTEFMAYLTHDSWDVRAVALFLVTELYPGRSETTEAIRKRLFDDHLAVRESAADALRKIQSRQDEAK